MNIEIHELAGGDVDLAVVTIPDADGGPIVTASIAGPHASVEVSDFDDRDRTIVSIGPFSIALSIEQASTLGNALGQALFDRDQLLDDLAMAEDLAREDQRRVQLYTSREAEHEDRARLDRDEELRERGEDAF